MSKCSTNDCQLQLQEKEVCRCDSEDLVNRLMPYNHLVAEQIIATRAGAGHGRSAAQQENEITRGVKVNLPQEGGTEVCK